MNNDKITKLLSPERGESKVRVFTKQVAGCLVKSCVTCSLLRLLPAVLF